MTASLETTAETPLRVRVAEEVRVALARKRMSAAKLGRELGVSQTYVWRRLNGETAFDLDDIERIATILEVSAMSLLPGGSPEKVGDDDRPTRNVSRPIDNRPSAGPGRGSPAAFRRPARVPRSGEGRRA